MSEARLAGLLATLAAGRTGEQLHEHILGQAHGDYDPRLDSVIADPAQFVQRWHGLLDGQDLPDSAWTGVVLPVIVACSNDRTLKTHLELATSYWVAARREPRSTTPAPIPVSPPPTITRGYAPPLADVPTPEPTTAPPRPRRSRFAAVAVLVVLAICATVVLLWTVPLGTEAPKSLAPSDLFELRTEPVPPSPDRIVPVAGTQARSATAGPVPARFGTTPPPVAATTAAAPIPSPSSEITITPSPVPLGEPFTISGSRWPCPVAEVRIVLDDQEISVATVDGGTFTTTITPETTGSGPPRIPTLGGGYLVIRTGTWAGQVTGASCSPQAFELTFS